MYRVRQNKVAPSIFCDFLSNRLEFKCEILHTYLVIIYAFNSRISIQLAYSTLKLSALQCWHLAISARSKTLYENLCMKIVQNSFNDSK